MHIFPATYLGHEVELSAHHKVTFMKRWMHFTNIYPGHKINLATEKVLNNKRWMQPFSNNLFWLWYQRLATRRFISKTIKFIRATRRIPLYNQQEEMNVISLTLYPGHDIAKKWMEYVTSHLSMKVNGISYHPLILTAKNEWS